LSVNVGWPGPIESVDGFEGSNPSVAQSAIEAPPFALGLFDLQQLLDPGLSSDFFPPENQAKEAKAVQPRLGSVGVEKLVSLLHYRRSC
jgi:hypothetical protein